MATVANTAANGDFGAAVSDKRAFITGADGFIGSHLVEVCARVKALVNYSSFDSDGWLDDLTAEVRDEVEVVRGDVRDADLIRDLIDGSEIVFHLASLIAIPYSYRAPSSYVQTNVQGSLNVFQAAHAAGVERIVHTSTSEVYGSARIRPITEDHPLTGQSPYSASKIAADKMAEAMHLSFDLPVVTLRPFNTFGPRQSQRAVIPTVTRQALDERAAEIRLGDTSPERDFTYVADTAQAFLAAAGDGAQPGKTYNCGTGRAITIADVVTEIVRLSDCAKPVVTDTDRLRPDRSEVRALEADFSAFHAATGWQPAHALSEGLAQTIDWWRDRPLGNLGKGYRI